MTTEAADGGYPEYSRAEMEVALLDFIELTTMSAQTLSTPGVLLPETEAFGHRNLEYWNEISLGIICIKGCLNVLDGLQVDFIDPRDGEHMIGKITDIENLNEDMASWKLIFKNTNKYQHGILVPLTPDQLREAANVSQA